MLQSWSYCSFPPLNLIDICSFIYFLQFIPVHQVILSLSFVLLLPLLWPFCSVHQTLGFIRKNAFRISKGSLSLSGLHYFYINKTWVQNRSIVYQIEQWQIIQHRLSKLLNIKGTFSLGSAWFFLAFNFYFLLCKLFV